MVALVISILLKTVRRGRHVKLATSPTPRHCTIAIGSRNQMTSAKKIVLETNLELGATAQPSATLLKLEICQSTWLYYQFSSVFLFHKNDQPKKIKACALLDNASGGTFGSVESANALCIEGSDTDLVLTTIHGTCNVRTKAIEGLVVVYIIKEEDVKNVGLAQNIHSEYHPSSPPRNTATIGKIAHLEEASGEIAHYMEDIEVGLLIGLNCPRILRQREVVYGEESNPYAKR